MRLRRLLSVSRVDWLAQPMARGKANADDQGREVAFVLVAKDFNSFGNLLIRKLIAEIALIGPRGEILPR